MRIVRTLPPAAAPVPLWEIIKALPACFKAVSEESKLSLEIEEAYNVRYCFLVSSGKAALTLTLYALKQLYPERSEVVIPAYTCYSVPAAIKRANLEIRLCDLAPDSLDFDLGQLAKIIYEDKKRKKILCIILTHLLGCVSDPSDVGKITEKKIPIVEDAAQAMGEELKGKKLGTLTDIGFYSLGRGKALSTMGGGIIVTNRDDIAIKLKHLISSLPSYSKFESAKLAAKALLTNIFQYPALFRIPKAMPFLRLGETIYDPEFVIRQISHFQIDLAQNWKQRLQQHRQARQRNINLWVKKLPSFLKPLADKMNVSCIRLPVIAENTAIRETILQFSEKGGFGITAMYPTPINKIPELSKEFGNKKFENAQSICNRLLTFPVHELVKRDDIEKVCSLLSSISVKGE